jgi:centrosomal protein CEP290
METNEKLRIKLKQQEITNEQLQNKLSNAKEKLMVESTKQLSMSGMDSKEWKGVVVGKMNEEKIRALEEDVDKKV